MFEIESAKWGLFALLISLINAFLPMEDISKWLEASEAEPSNITLFEA